jgi:hypothetical protein
MVTLVLANLLGLSTEVAMMVTVPAVFGAVYTEATPLAV